MQIARKNPETGEIEYVGKSKVDSELSKSSTRPAQNRIITSALSNPNLLDNPWFTVNQRGKSVYSADDAYTVDRWQKFQPEAIVSVTDNGIRITGNESGTKAYVYQIFDERLRTELTSKVVTLSIIARSYGNSNHSICMRVGNSVGKTIQLTNEWTVESITMAATFGSVANYDKGVILCSMSDDLFTTDEGIEVKAVKLELGSVSTIDMDTVPNYATELMKCRLYYQEYSLGSKYANIGQGYTISDTTARILIPISPIRSNPALVFSSVSDFQLLHNFGPIKEITSMTIHDISNNYVTIDVVSSNMTASLPCIFRTGDTTNAKIGLSADL